MITVSPPPVGTSKSAKVNRPRRHRIPLNRLRSNLGGDPALMALRYGSKVRTRPWERCRNDEILKKQNIAVAQGDIYRHPTRGTEIDCKGVCSIDIDGDQENGITPESVAERLFKLNPALQWSFRTGANRGFNVWVRLEQDVPTGFNLYTQDDIKVGEFRATGNYTLVEGRHPDGPSYRTIVDLPAIKLPTVSAIKWIDGKPLCKKSTQDYKERYIGVKEPISGRVELIAPLVSLSLPTAPHQTHQKHFELAGEIKGSPYSITDSEAFAVGQLWWDLADKRYLRPNLSQDQYAAEFVCRFKFRKFAKGQGSEAFDNALERANQLDPPQLVVGCFPHDSRRQFIGSLCRELARESSNKRFFLAARTIQAQLNTGSPTMGSKILKDLEAIGLVACVDRPPRGARKANSYLYLGNDFDLEVES